MTTDKKLLDPENNVILVSNKRELRFFVYLAKIFLNKFENVELHALGQAITTCVGVSETVQRQGLATVSSVQTNSIVPQTQNDSQAKSRKSVKLIVQLKRAADFQSKVAQDLKK